MSRRVVRLFFCAKKIVYLSLYEREERTGSAGFAGIYGEKEDVRITLQIKTAEAEGTYPVSLILRGQEIAIGKIELKKGCGTYERRFALDREGMLIASSHAAEKDLEEVCVALDGGRSVRGIWMKSSGGGNAAPQEREGRTDSGKERQPEEGKAGETQTEETAQKIRELEALQKRPEKEQERRERRREQESVRAEEEEVFYQQNYLSDKWEQMKSQYSRVHPFGDDREFISIELKDFVVLREPCQRLINNSFLLHGFYNYRHLILGKDCRIGDEREICFYLGVPGVFFEREKMVAVMFGFEGFECAGPVEIGKFGYYMRRVDI